MKTTKIRSLVLLSMATVVTGITVYAQQRGPRGRNDAASLAEPFRGVTANGKIE